MKQLFQVLILLIQSHICLRNTRLNAFNIVLPPANYHFCKYTPKLLIIQYFYMN